METGIKNRILQSIGNVFDKSEASKLEDKLFREIESDLAVLSAYFHTTPMQAFILAHIFALNYKGDTVDFSDLVDHLKCNPMKLLVYNNDIETLWSKGLIIRERSRHRPEVSLSNDQFTVSETITQAILDNKPVPETTEKIGNVIGLLEKINDMAEKSNDKMLHPMELFERIRLIIEAYQEYSLIKKVKQMKLGDKDAFLFLYLTWKTITGTESVSIGTIGDMMFRNQVKKIAYIQKILNNENDLITKELLEIVPEKFFHDTQLKLTDLSLAILQENGIKLFVKNKRNRQVVAPETIPFKQLFYNDENKKQLELVENSLKERNLRKIQKRLSGKNLPQGITVLLYGPPGTGKTETVFQWAKRTNREIIRLDISRSKSFWFGESEKIVKKIFTDYRTYARQCKITPILLFNEADAIITKRVNRSESPVSQTENAIQNIILEELEHFEGIFIATTNLAENLDSAFDRRFLFKIKLEKPEVSVKATIWKSKLKSLSISNCKLLAGRFDFSGGQIDNVVRKTEMNEIIYGPPPEMENIVRFCEEEEMQKSTRIKIGYLKN